MKEIFPDPIRNLPEADIPLKGLKSYLSQSEKVDLRITRINSIRLKRINRFPLYTVYL